MSKLKTNITVDQFIYPESTPEQLEFAKRTASLLGEIINHKKFQSAIASAKFSYCVLVDEHGKA
ncbi:hypothetical protein [Sphingobacterium thalpophilum]|uniref:hypothetical protein n=1 Tax=Sphingobacterium thalpophilum TaxID=259 RepID=UPI003D978683